MIASNRSAVRHTLRTRVACRRGRHSFTGIYEWLGAFDDGDGPFTYSEHANDLAAEWAHTAGLPPHAIGVVSNLVLPVNVHVTVSDRWQSSALYNITAPSDVDGNGVFVDRPWMARELQALARSAPRVNERVDSRLSPYDVAPAESTTATDVEHPDQKTC